MDTLLEQKEKQAGKRDRREGGGWGSEKDQVSRALAGPLALQQRHLSVIGALYNVEDLHNSHSNDAF